MMEVTAMQPTLLDLLDLLEELARRICRERLGPMPFYKALGPRKRAQAMARDEDAHWRAMVPEAQRLLLVRNGRPPEQIGGSPDGLTARAVGGLFTSGCPQTSKSRCVVTNKVKKTLTGNQAQNAKRPRDLTAARPNHDAKWEQEQHG
jgi:hypothetical protein